MNVLVTGATGFIGRGVVLRLLARGMQVRALARSRERASVLANQGVEIVWGDITDRDALEPALAGVDVVYHLAGKLLTPGVPTAEYRRIHVDGTSVLLDCCLKQPRQVRLVHVSTTGVLGVTGDHPADEASPVAPTNAYEATKAEAEERVRAADATGLSAVIVRPGLVYGPGDLHLLGFFRSIQRGLFRPIGVGPVWLHPIFLDDLIDALVLCGEHPRAPGECFHIAGETPVTLVDLAATIASALGVAIPRGTIPVALARAAAVAGELLPPHLRSRAPLTLSRLGFLTHSRIYDVTKARRLLGFVTATGLAIGIAQTVAWYEQEGLLSPVRSRTGATSKQSGVTR